MSPAQRLREALTIRKRGDRAAASARLEGLLEDLRGALDRNGDDRRARRAYQVALALLGRWEEAIAAFAHGRGCAEQPADYWRNPAAWAESRGYPWEALHANAHGAASERYRDTDWIPPLRAERQQFLDGMEWAKQKILSDPETALDDL